MGTRLGQSKLVVSVLVPNWNQAQVLELTKSKLTRNRVKYGTKKELKGLVQPICKTRTQPKSQFQVGKKIGTGLDFFQKFDFNFLFKVGLGIH